MEYNLSKMYKMYLLLFAVCLMTSCSNTFVRKFNFIDKLPVQISLDSTLVLLPAFSMTHHTSSNTWNVPIRQAGRPDTFIRILKSVFNQNGMMSVFDKNLSGKCMNDKVIYMKWNVEEENDFDTHKCLPLQSGLYNIFFNVSMDISESSGDNNPREFSSIICYALVIKESQVLFYRCYFAYRVARKKHFPKGSADRKDYPYFANDQIERVVKNITADLIKRIVPATK